jgi:hypothetical protein
MPTSTPSSAKIAGRKVARKLARMRLDRLSASKAKQLAKPVEGQSVIAKGFQFFHYRSTE